MKLSKRQLSKIVQSGGFLGRPVLKTGLFLMKNLLKKTLAKRFLIPLGLTAAASAASAGIQNKILGSAMTKLII